ncbi:epididymal secretory protein E1 [Elysia marginata]|uniref:Epididymal secretory protein E1 n=1 Tax=Elysia marginata TaxID=1093978 RepID=A0AAV4J1Y0_9GAST|nr:epididymal secretory protein E1 [Elysia marginata]
MMFHQLTLCLATLLVLTAAESITYKDCPNGDYVHARAVRISPCPSQPCSFKHNQTVNVEIDFTPRDNSDILESTVYGIVGGFPVPYSLPNPDACKDSAITCPISQGQVLTYKSHFDVLNSYPKINIVVMWQLNAGKSNQACFTFPMAIV